jgi:hypothetical protein
VIVSSDTKQCSEYSLCKVSIDPYFLGLWLGDGDPKVHESRIWTKRYWTTVSHMLAHWNDDYDDRMGSYRRCKSPPEQRSEQ